MSTHDEAGRTTDPSSGRAVWTNFLIPAFIFAFCGVVTYVSLTLDEALPIIVGDSMQPRVFPIFLMVVIAILNLGIILQLVCNPPRRINREPAATWITVVLMGVFYFLTEFVDIMLALAAVMFAMCMIWGERRWWVATLTALITTGAIFFSFDLILEVRFPRGLFTDWYYG